MHEQLALVPFLVPQCNTLAHGACIHSLRCNFTTATQCGQTGSHRTEYGSDHPTGRLLPRSNMLLYEGQVSPDTPLTMVLLGRAKATSGTKKRQHNPCRAPPDSFLAKMFGTGCAAQPPAPWRLHPKTRLRYMYIHNIQERKNPMDVKEEENGLLLIGRCRHARSSLGTRDEDLNL